MTVNALYLTAHGTVHATDSLIVDGAGRRVETTSGRSKTVQLPAYQGAASWFGFASFPDWQANEWLTTSEEKYKGSTPDDFGEQLAKELNDLLEANSGAVTPQRHMGIHFTFYEKIGERMIPELIWITNNNGITSTGAYVPTPGRAFVAQRQTFHTITGSTDFETHASDACRNQVANHLEMIGPLPYQNGDNPLVNTSVPLTEAMIALTNQRRLLRAQDPLRLFGQRALFRVEIATLTQRLFYREDRVIVGGPCFNLMIPPQGEFITDTPAT